jgi:hypothetical protein
MKIILIFTLLFAPLVSVAQENVISAFEWLAKSQSEEAHKFFKDLGLKPDSFSEGTGDYVHLIYKNSDPNSNLLSGHIILNKNEFETILGFQLGWNDSNHLRNTEKLLINKGYTLMKSSSEEVVYSNGIYIFIFGYKRLTSEGYPILVFVK